jgi:hypothetical protein
MLKDETEKTWVKKKQKDNKQTRANLLNLGWSLELTTCEILDCLKLFHSTKTNCEKNNLSK